jgi:glycosyltransferase involved in cell wall biosynthesis
VRILHIIGWLAPRYGGTSEVVRQSQFWLSARGHEVDIVTTNVDGGGVLDVELGRPLEWDGACATFHPLGRPRKFLTSWSLLADLRQRIDTYDVVHIHSLYRFHTIAAAVTARRRGVPYVLQPHGSLDHATRAHRRRLKDGYHALIEDSNIRHASRLLATSSQEARAIRELGYRVPTSVVPLGVDSDALRVPSDPANILAMAGARDDARLVTFLGRISRGKGVELLVQSFARTAALFPDSHLVIAGPDDEGIGERLAPDIAAAGLQERISFVGILGLSDKRALLQRSDVLVLPSAGESFGLAVAEAMAVGCPVVVSSAVPLQADIRATEAGLVVEREASEIAEAVRTILANPELAAGMGDSGRRLIDHRFGWPQVAVELERMYESVAAHPPAREAVAATNGGVSP